MVAHPVKSLLNAQPTPPDQDALGLLQDHSAGQRIGELAIQLASLERKALVKRYRRHVSKRLRCKEVLR
jgi:hypothetical protein